MRLALVLAGVAVAALAAAPQAALADKIRNPTAVFAGLDKITGRIITFEAQVDETVQFGALQLTTRVCNTRPPTEPVNTTAFIEVDEVTFTNEYRRIFGGWIFASTPGLHGIEHPIYDVWLTGCKGGTTVIPDQPEVAERPDLKPLDPKLADKRQNRPLQPGETIDNGRIGVAAPVGVPVAPRQPSQRFFPATSATPLPNQDPYQNTNR